MMNQDEIIHKASEISRFCMQLSHDHTKRAYANNGMPFDDFCYAEAILLWKSKGTDKDYFSTEDKFLLEFRMELQKEFELEIITREEAKQRTGKTKIVTGIATVTEYIN